MTSGPLGSIVFLSPDGALVAIAAVIPIAAVAIAAARVNRARRLLGLNAPPPARRVPRLAGLLAVPALLGLAAAQPALRSETTARLRTDAQAMFVIDVSRSMQASKGPSGATRLERARHDAIELRAAIPEVASGVATLTDRVLPDLLPNADPAVFDDTVEHAVAIEQPPPASENVVATTLGSLGALGTLNYFSPSARHRLVVVLTDGESRPFDVRQVAHALATGPGVKLVLVHTWASGEAVYDGTSPERGYRESSTSGAALASLAAAADGRVFGEQSVAAAAGAARADLGSGPTVVRGRAERTRTLAPYVALLTLAPLAAALGLHRLRPVSSSLRLGRAAGESAADATPRATPASRVS